MPAPSYTFSQFLDMLLVRLYDLDREQEPGAISYFDLGKIGSEIIEKAPDRWILDAGNVLASRGLADGTINSMGVFARITGEGRLYVEEGRGITKRIKDFPDNYFNINISVSNASGDVNVSGTGSITQTKSTANGNGLAVKLLHEIRDKIGSDTALPPDEKSEALGNIEAIERETKRADPDRSLLSIFLHRLERFSSVASNVATLAQLFNR